MHYITEPNDLGNDSVNRLLRTSVGIKSKKMSTKVSYHNTDDSKIGGGPGPITVFQPKKESNSHPWTVTMKGGP